MKITIMGEAPFPVVLLKLKRKAKATENLLHRWVLAGNAFAATGVQSERLSERLYSRRI